MCDQDHVSFFTCPHCSTCQVSKTWGDFPVHVTGKKGQLDVYCIITDPRCDWYYNGLLGRSVRQNGKGITGDLPQPSFGNFFGQNNNNGNNSRTNTQTKTDNSKNTQQKNNTNKSGNNTNNKATTANANNKTSTTNTTNKTNKDAGTNKAATSNKATAANTTNGVNVVSTGATAGAGAAVAAGAVAATESVDKTDAVVNDGIKSINGTESTIDSSSNQIVNSEVNSTTNGNIDGNIQNQIDDGNSNVSPYVIGSLSFFTILLIVVGFLYVKKRKSDNASDLDPIYRNSSVFFATPILEKRNSQVSERSQKSNISKFSTHTKTAISSGNDGDYDIVISPTNAATAAITAAANESMTQQAPIENTTYGDTRAYEGNSISGINVSATENFISQSNINGLDYNNTSLVGASNIIAQNTMPGNVSENIISPVVPNSVNQNINVQYSSFSYDINDVSTHDPSASFINSTNGISFIKSSKDESCMLSPIMDKSESNVFSADMVNENSINVDLKHLTSTPKLNNSTGKKTLSMVISEYKEDVIYLAKFNYEPSMEDEMKIKINDRVLVKEIFNDGWAYGENKTSESFGIFPINRLDSSS
ncbi:hypothetical protein H8356DRAFT_1285463 [Neocallimastix lanati (nom. inval.)]|jgi:hypothetical protein|uniref:SH3 domain-containing protein n=1 Tax=Neocallimastix californiae TaxID=1754190 RepID=A0A1Y2FTK9_9FUNG|nr:hypothetical protein H8356DRAFT_1285463 [Neocallimastix sp. JGI-2020a]ORY86526.1 hypothetical protein LY90DRAFT_663176 [Neocallimastix californiae]|eukprot:ORY86526.1 hypothetical protein LY90DRAFT_663176 [Neocallimastix californiae]